MGAESDLKVAFDRAVAAGDREAADIIRQQMRARVDPLGHLYSAAQAASAAGDADAAGVIQELIQAEVRKMRGADIAEETRVPERIAAGVGAGMSSVGKNLADVAADATGIEAIRPNPAAWADERADADLLTSTRAGAVGKMAGEMAALPLGAVGKGLQALAPAAKGVPALSRLLGSRALASTAEGVGAGYLLAGPENRGAGATVGGLVGYAVPRAGAALSSAWRGVVQPSPVARYLMDKGADELTIGQMAPGSKLAQIEQAGQSVAGAGPILTGQRNAGQASWQSAVLREAGETGPAVGSLNDRAAAIYGDLGAAYDDIATTAPSARAAARPPNPSRIRRALGLAAEDKSVMATEADVSAVSKYLGNQASLAERQGVASPEVLLRIRSNIRDQARGLEAGDPKLQLLKRAEESIDNRIRYVLPGDALRKLKATDAQYAKYKTVERALRKAKDSPTGFTPHQLSNAVSEGIDPGAYARGAGGEMRKLAAAGRETLDTTSPPTGARGVTLQVPVVKHLLAGGVALANTSPIKRALLGDYAAQRAMHKAEEYLRRKGLADALRRAAIVGTAD